jgi:hypothetical protein
MQVMYNVKGICLAALLLAGCASQPAPEPPPPPPELPTAQMPMELDPTAGLDPTMVSYEVMMLPAEAVTQKVGGTVVYLAADSGWAPVNVDQVIDDGDRFVIEKGAELTISYEQGSQLEFVAMPVRRWYQVEVKKDNIYNVENAESGESE